MVIIKNRVRERLCHVADNLCLSYQLQCSMFDKLQYVWRPIRTVKINIALLLINKGLIA